jgi:hypothetical protein
MVPYLGCEHARGMLQAFLDGELPVDDQVAVETHLRWCRTCAAHVDDLRLIGDSLRLGAGNTTDDDQRELSALHAAVLSRVHAEHDQSLPVKVRALFDDLHLFWAGLGAVTAVIVCLFATMSVMHAASVERPDSLAGVIQSLANPGSDRNPMLLDGRIIQMPRALDDAPSLDTLKEDEAVFALATVVTREGRVANYEVLMSERDGAPRPGRVGRQVTRLLDQVARSRFSPAEQGVAREPVAVNMVWLLARTTVKGTHRAIDFDARPAVEPAPVVVPAAVKPATEEGMQDQSARRPAVYVGVSTT